MQLPSSDKMIHYIRGKVIGVEGGSVLIDTALDGESGLGFEVTAADPKNTVGLPSLGDSVQLYIYPIVRDDRFEYFGFRTLEERRVFKTLIGVNGVGPRAAISLLSQAGVYALVQAVLNRDKVFLTSVPGVGKKTAERILIELLDRFEAQIASGELALNFGATSTERELDGSRVVQYNEVVSALVGLGYRDSDVKSAVRKILDINDTDNIEAIIKMALKEL